MMSSREESFSKTPAHSARSLGAVVCSRKRQPTRKAKTRGKNAVDVRCFWYLVAAKKKKRSERVNEINQFVYLNEVAGLPVAAAASFSLSLSLLSSPCFFVLVCAPRTRSLLFPPIRCLLAAARCCDDDEIFSLLLLVASSQKFSADLL